MWQPGESAAESKTGFAGRGDGDDDCGFRDGVLGSSGGLDGQHEALAHAAREGLPSFGRAAVDPHPFEFANRGDGLELRLGLKAAADHRERSCVFAGHVARGDTAGRARANLPEHVGVDAGEQLGRLGVEQQHGEASAHARACRIDLGCQIAGLVLSRGHVMQAGAVVEHDPPARLVHCAAVGEVAEPVLDEFDGLGHGESFADLVFGDVDHAGKPRVRVA